ncbi:MAG: M28 family peptidase [Thermoplasmata archaeon]
MNRGASSSVLVALSIAFLVALPVTTAGDDPKQVDWTALVVERLDMEYAEEIIEEVCAIGDSPLGFRGAGGPADHKAADYIVKEMRKIGLDDIDKEPVPLSAWEFREAYLDVPGIGKMTAASFGGFPGTDDQSTKKVHEAIVEEIVWVGNGYDSDYDGKEVEGKIVLANWIGYDFWVDSIAFGAWEHGAAGIVITTIDCNVGQNVEALSCHDGLYVTGWPPLISISKENGTKIVERLEAGEGITVTMYSDILKTPPELGGVGYNVVGYLPGKNYGTPADEFVIFGPHHDAWFEGAMDDTSGIAAMLVIAKAMQEVVKENGIDLERTIVFTSHTAEEYGIDNTYFDWCWGAYYQITVEHPEWVGRSAAYLCMELMGMAGDPVDINCVPEIATFVRQVLASNTENTPYGAHVTDAVYCWADHWTFSAAGVPGIEFASTSEEWSELYYHTQCDAPDIIDYGYLEQLFAIVSDMTVRLATYPVIPYNFKTLASDLNSHLNGDNLWGVEGLYEIYDEYGFDRSVNLQKTVDEAAAFAAKAELLKEMLMYVDPEDAGDINSQLMSIAGTLDQSLIAIGVWEQSWYPYQQPINDVYHMYKTIQALKAYPTDESVGLGIGTLNWVGMTWYYSYMSYANYLDQRDRLTGDRVASWGLQTHLQLSVDVWDEYDALVKMTHGAGHDSEALADVLESLEEKLCDISIVQLENAFEWMWTALHDANQQIDELMADL